MSANRKRHTKSKVSELEKQKRKVSKLEEKSERLAERRRSYKKEPKLKFQPWRYEHRRLETGSIDLDDMRKEYSRLRSIANKRIERVGMSEFAKYSETYKAHQGGFAKLEDLSEMELIDELAEVVKFLNAKRSSLAYLKIERQALLTSFEAENERRKLVNLQIGEDVFDYLPVSEKDQRSYWEFLNFLNTVGKSISGRAWYESQKEMWDVLRQKHISWKEVLTDAGLTPSSDVSSITKAFSFWSEHKKEIELLDRETVNKVFPVDKERTSASAFRKFLQLQDKNKNKRSVK